MHLNAGTLRATALILLAVAVTALVLSALWRVPYICTVTAFAALPFFGFLVVFDEFRPGGWGNPMDVEPEPFPTAILAFRAIAFFLLLGIALSPAARTFGDTVWRVEFGRDRAASE